MAESGKALGLRHQRRQYPSTAHSGQRLNTNAIEITRTVRIPLFFPLGAWFGRWRSSWGLFLKTAEGLTATRNIFGVS